MAPFSDEIQRLHESETKLDNLTLEKICEIEKKTWPIYTELTKTLGSDNHLWQAIKPLEADEPMTVIEFQLVLTFWRKECEKLLLKNLNEKSDSSIPNKSKERKKIIVDIRILFYIHLFHFS